MARNSLAILSSAALSLPAIAADQPADTTISVRASHYEEGAISKRDVIAGDTDRYDIDIYQFRLLAPLGRNWSLGLGVSREIMSGASPWGGVDLPDGAQLIMSGATIADARTETSLTVTRYGGDHSASLLVAHSDEDDYESKAATLAVDWEIGESGTLALAASYASDDLSPTDAAVFGRVASAEKRSRSLSLSWTQIVDRNSLLQLGSSFTERTGFLSDPYKLRDVRPSNRRELTVSTRYRRYFEQHNASLHIDYRYYQDDYDIQSHTLDASWHQPIGDRFRLVPGLRYYTQHEADFYNLSDNFLLPLTQAQSSDFRLSTFGALAFRLKGVYSLNNWTVDLMVERYISSADYGLYKHSGEEEHAALLDYNLVSMGVSYRF